MRKYLVVGLMFITAIAAGVVKVLPETHGSIVTTSDRTGIHVSFSHLSGKQRCGAYIISGDKRGTLRVELKGGEITVKVLENGRVVYREKLNRSSTRSLTFHGHGLCSLEIECSNASGRVDLNFT